MTTALLAPTPLHRLKELAQRSAGLVAVPFIGKGAATLLPLQQGTILVTRLDEPSVRQGLVHPGEIAKMIRHGVEVHCCGNLHAKVYVFGKRAVIGSANVSASSISLVEAAAETTDPAVVRQAKEFVLSLCVDPVGLEFVRSLTPLYPTDRPGMRGAARAGANAVAQHSRMFVAPVEEVDWPAEAKAADRRGTPAASRRIKDQNRARLEKIDWTDSDWRKLARGDRVVERRTDGRGYKFDPPSRVVHIEPYGDAAVVYLERQKHIRAVPSARVRSLLGDDAKAFTYRGNGTRMVRRSRAVAQFVRLWPRLNSP